LHNQKSCSNGSAMNLGVEAGRLAYLAGRMEKKHYASASSPLEQISKLT
jgi:thiazole synthase